jgi:CRP-like cAMP-binding protein
MTSRTRRGRPLKFGRPSRTIAVTLPKDTIAALHAKNPDLASAIVALVDKRLATAIERRTQPPVTLAHTGRRQSLIVVDPTVVSALPGCTLMRISPNRAFITLGPGAGLADLEVAVLDRLTEANVNERERRGLQLLRQSVKRWRKDAQIQVYPRAIVVLGEA